MKRPAAAHAQQLAENSVAKQEVPASRQLALRDAWQQALPAARRVFFLEGAGTACCARQQLLPRDWLLQLQQNVAS